MSRPRIAVVVQRCHQEVVGGSEALAWQYARLLSDRFDVEILTSTALDHGSWKDALPEGLEEREGVGIRRFRSAVERGPYWDELYRRLLPGGPASAAPGPPPRRLALQEELVRFQGPWCPGLLGHLETHREEYGAFVFCTYLYPPSYFGMGLVDPDRSVLVPTLHDEPLATFSCFRLRAERVREILWLTPAEQRAGKRLWGVEHGRVIGMDVAVPEAAPWRPGFPYVLYCGRFEPGKGARELFDHFARYKRERPSPLKLLLTGQAVLPVPQHPDVAFLGFVEPERKFSLMRGARAFVIASHYESFSIATLEAMGQGVPVLANGRCEVLRDHVELSGGGRCFTDYPGFRNGLDALAGGQHHERAGRAARAYVLERFSGRSIGEQLAAVVGALL